MAEKHKERGLFIKDVIGSNEICCWTFYGPGGVVKKVAEVCCTSIVYATDKKHTKVFVFKSVHLKKKFSVNIIYKPGRENVVVDFLFGFSLPTGEKKMVDDQLIDENLFII